jgi:cell division septal protein FtsQ
MKPIRSTHKDFLRSQSLTRRRRKKKVLKVWLAILSGLVFCICLAWLFSLQSLAVKKVIVIGNTNITSGEIQNITNTILDGKYLGIFSKRNVFIYPKDYITRTLSQTYPRIEDIVLDTESLEILNIKVKERTPSSVWCAAVLCYLVDGQGYIFAESTSSTTSHMHAVLYGGDQFVGPEPIGKHIFTENLYKDILKMIDELEKEKLTIKEVHVFSRDEIVFSVANGGKIIFSDRKPFTVSLENLKTSLKSSVFVGQKSGSSSSSRFEYIDVRFGNKVFYKLNKNNEELQLNTSSSSKNTI